jgi:hypothetical protein
MAGFLYYLCGISTPVGEDRLRKLGLGYALGTGVSCVMVGRGPDGESGLVVADTKRLGNQCAGYYPAEQTWQLIPPSLLSHSLPPTPIWVGHYTADPPKPEELLRPDALRGELLVLGDNRAPGWQIPILRGVVADPLSAAGDVDLVPMVPVVAGVDEEGRWQAAQVAARYQPAWAAALAWCDAKAQIEFGQEDEYGSAMGSFTFETLLDSAALVLGLNYAVGKIEIAALGLFDTASPRRILDAATDWQAFEAWFKKKLANQVAGLASAVPAGSDSSDGCKEETRPTPQPSASG